MTTPTLKEQLEEILNSKENNAFKLAELVSLFESSLKEERAEEAKKYKHLGYIDATPDGNYALRLLQKARADCNIQWSDNTGGLGIKNPLLKELNKMQKERAKELDDILELLGGREK